MDFKEAHQKLLEGYAVHRKCWNHGKHVKIIDSKPTTFNEFVAHFYFDPDMINSNEWVIAELDETYAGLYNFPEMLELLNEGKKMRYQEWKPSTYIILSRDKKDVFLHTLEKHHFTFGIDDFISRDWEIFSEQL